MNGNHGYRRFLLLLVITALAGQTLAIAQSCPIFYICYNEGTLTFANQVAGTISAGQLIPITYWTPPTYGLQVSGDFVAGPRTTCGFTTPTGSGCLIEILFRPTQIGQRTGQLTLTFLSTSDVIQFWVLTGTGVSPAPPPPPPPSPCDINKNGKVDIGDVQLVVNEILGFAPPVSDLDGDGKVTVGEVQLVVNAVLGLGCKSTP